MFFKLKRVFVFLVLAGLLCVQGCESISPSVKKEKDSSEKVAEKVYGVTKGLFRHRWWHYYERALSFMEGGFWKEAEKDLREAIRQRETDQWDARTYGMHFIDYFPNRELGIAHYYLNNMEDARTELKLSLSQTPSAKTIFYLKKVYKDLITKNTEIDGEVIEMSFPKIRIDNFRTKDEPVVIAGDVEDETYIKSIYVNDEPVYWLNSLEDFERNLDEKQLSRVQKKEFPKDLKTKVSFKKQLLFLPQGKQSVVIKAENIKGGIRSREIEVHVDRIGPMISVNDIEPLESSGKKLVKVSGFLNDESGVSALSVNGVSKFAINEKVISIEENRTVSFDETIEIDENDGLEIVAYDCLGNETSTRIPVADSVATTGGSALFASSGVTDGKNWVAKNGNKPPSIKIVNPINEKELISGYELYVNLLPIKIETRGEKESIKIWINNKFITQGKIISLPYYLNLNRIVSEEEEFIIKMKCGNHEASKTIKAVEFTEDFNLNETDSDCIVVRKKNHKAFNSNERLNLLILPFKYIGRGDDTYSQRINENVIQQINLIYDFTQQSRFRVISSHDIPEEFFERVVAPDSREDVSRAILQGKEFEVRFVMIGTINKRNVEGKDGEIELSFDIKTKVLDTGKPQELCCLTLDTPIDAHEDKEDENALQSIAKELSAKFSVEFPLLVGKINNIENKTVKTDLSHYKLRENNRLIAYREKDIEVDITGHAKLKQVFQQQQYSFAELYYNVNAKEGDKIITE